jgi:small neutral amino acid transporter SnatA (MarC family)
LAVPILAGPGTIAAAMNFVSIGGVQMLIEGIKVAFSLA